MTSRNKEQEFIDNLESRVSESYENMQRNVKYRGRGRCGEIDFMGHIKGVGWDIYEVKTTLSDGKLRIAKQQLNRAASCAPYNINDMYIYIGRDDELIYVGHNDR